MSSSAVRRPAPRLRTRLGFRFRNGLPQGPNENGSDDWMGGVEWTSEPCRKASLFHYQDWCDDCEPVIGVNPDKPEPCGPPSSYEARPFEIIVESDCEQPTGRSDLAEFGRRRRAVLERTVDMALARQLQFGSGIAGDPTPTLIKDGLALGNGSVAPSVGLGMIADAASQRYGGGGYLIGSEYTASILAQSGLLTAGAGGTFQTALGYPLIVGPGFDPKIGPSQTANPDGTGSGIATTPAGAGEAWLWIVRSADWYLESGLRDLLEEDEASQTAQDWELIGRNKYAQVSETTALVRLDGCGIYGVKIKSCECC